MNEDSVYQNCPQTPHCKGAFYDAGLCGKFCRIKQTTKKKKKISLPCPLFTLTNKLFIILKNNCILSTKALDIGRTQAVQ